MVVVVVQVVVGKGKVVLVIKALLLFAILSPNQINFIAD